MLATALSWGGVAPRFYETTRFKSISASASHTILAQVTMFGCDLQAHYDLEQAEALLAERIEREVKHMAHHALLEVA